MKKSASSQIDFSRKARQIPHKAYILLRGNGERKGLLYVLFRYVLLTAIAFIFAYPLLSMLSLSIQPMEDLTDFSTRWLPSSLTLIHFQNAYLVMDYTKSFIMTANLAFISSLFQTAVCALTGYGFAKFDFPLKKIWLGVLLLCYLLPAQVLAVPNYLLFNQLGLIDGSLRPFIITSMLGKGINSSLCVLIFYMFYRQMPAVLLEAAEIDGASNLKAFTRIALPMVVPGIIVVLIFSIVWYWNDTYLASTYIGYANLSNVNTTGTLMLQLDLFEGNYAYASIGAVNSPYKFSMAKKAAATMLAIAPVMIIYFFVQRKFMQSIDSVGITGE
mgnify:CR=1 FL=1